MSTAEGAKGIITDGLIVYLDASNPNSYPGSGTTFNNLASNLYSGSLVTASYTASNNGSILFNGSSSHISINNVIGSGLESQFTLNFWIKNTNNGAVGATIYSGLMCKIAGNDTNSNRFLINSSFNRFLFQVFQAQNGTEYVIFSNTFSSIQNQVTMCSLTYSSSLTSFYVNGSSVGTSNVLSGSLTSGSSNPTIGWGATTADYYFSGSIYSTQIYNRALSQSEIQQNYNAHYGKIVGFSNINP